MQIKKYQNTPGRLLKPIAASDMTYKVAAMPLRQLRNDVELLTLNTNRMRSTDAKEREAGRKAEVQRRKKKRTRAKQTANPHIDAASVPDNQFAMNVGDAAIELQVAQEAERNNPYGLYRRSFDPNSPLYQGAITGLSDAEAEERMGFFANLGDALGTTNARHDANRSLAARMTDLMLWNLDSRNPRSGETYSAITAPMISFGGAPATATHRGLTLLSLSTAGGEGFNQLWRIIPGTEGKTWSQWFGDKVPLATSNTGGLLNPGYFLGPTPFGSLRYRDANYTEVAPWGYGNSPLSRNQVKSAIIAFGKTYNPFWRFDKEVKPWWYYEIANGPKGFGLSGASIAEFRDLAYRQALRIPLRKDQIPIYYVNDEVIPTQRFSFGANKAERTYSYDETNVDRIRKINGDAPTFITAPEGVRWTWYGPADGITGNGGAIKYTEYPGRGTRNSWFNLNDRWDVHPFSDARSPGKTYTGWTGKLGKIAEKIAPNFELIEFAGGNPFVLNHTVTHPFPGFHLSSNKVLGHNPSNQNINMFGNNDVIKTALLTDVTSNWIKK